MTDEHYRLAAALLHLCGRVDVWGERIVEALDRLASVDNCGGCGAGDVPPAVGEAQPGDVTDGPLCRDGVVEALRRLHGVVGALRTAAGKVENCEVALLEAVLQSNRVAHGIPISGE